MASVWYQRFLFIIAAFGLLGNALMCFFMMKKRLRNKPYGLLLSILSISDTFNIIHLLLDATLVTTSLGVSWKCKIYEYVRHVFQYVSVWLIVLISVERVVVLFIPHRGRASCFSTSRTASYIVGILILCGVSQIYRLLFVEDMQYDEPGNSTVVCAFSGLEIPAHYEALLHLAAVFIVPSVCIFISNFICIGLMDRYTKRYSTFSPSRNVQFSQGRNDSPMDPILPKRSPFLNERNEPSLGCHHLHHHPYHYEDNMRPPHINSGHPPILLREPFPGNMRQAQCPNQPYEMRLDPTTSQPNLRLFVNRVRATQILLIITFLYVLCNIPKALCEIFMLYAVNNAQRSENHSFAIVTFLSKHGYPLVFLSSCISYGANFYIYLLFGEMFRKMVLQEFACCRRFKGHAPINLCYHIGNGLVTLFHLLHGCSLFLCWCCADETRSSSTRRNPTSLHVQHGLHATTALKHQRQRDLYTRGPLIVDQDFNGAYPLYLDAPLVKIQLHTMPPDPIHGAYIINPAAGGQPTSSSQKTFPVLEVPQ